MQFLALGRQMTPRGRARHRFDAPHSRRHRIFRHNRNQTDITRAGHMRAATEFNRIGPVRTLRHTHGHNTDFVAVFLTKERAGARLDRFLDAH